MRKTITETLASLYYEGVSLRRWFSVTLAVIAASAAIFAALAGRKPVSAPIGWEKAFVVSPARLTVRNFHAANRGNLAVAAFEADEGIERGIYATLSVSGGRFFFAPVRIASYTVPQSEYAPMNPKVAIASDGGIFVTWQGFSQTDLAYRIFYSESRDMGGTWSAPAIFAFNTPIDFIPEAFYDADNMLHVIYHSFEGNQFNLYHAYRKADGSFSASSRMTSLGAEFRGAFFPSVEVSGERIDMVWQGKSLRGGTLADDLYVISSTNNGSSWSSFTRITGMTGKGSSARPALKNVSGRLYLAYQNNDSGNWKIMLTDSVDGRSFSAPRAVFETNTNSFAPSLAWDGTDLVIFFYDNREGAYAVNAVEFSPATGTFGPPRRISDPGAAALNPWGISRGGPVLCLWQSGGRITGKFSDTSVEPPLVTSVTHPDNRWVRSERAVIQWTAPADESGIEGYAFIVNRERYFNPTVVNAPANIRSYTAAFLEDGVSYFHIRAVDRAGNYSRTVSYPLLVARTPLSIPVVQSSTHPEGNAVENVSPEFTWTIAEAERVKGYFYSLAPDRPESPRLFTEQSAVGFSNLARGRYFFSVKGLDRADVPGRVAVYEIIVGSAGAIDPTVYRRTEETRDDVVVRPAVRRRVAPMLKLAALPADDSGFTRINASVAGMPSARFAGVLIRSGVALGEVSSADGNFEFRDLGPGRYELLVRAESGAARLSRIISFDITSQPAATREDFSHVSAALLRPRQHELVMTVALPLYVLLLAGFGYRRRLGFALKRGVFAVRGLRARAGARRRLRRRGNSSCN